MSLSPSLSIYLSIYLSLSLTHSHTHTHTLPLTIIIIIIIIIIILCLRCLGCGGYINPSVSWSDGGNKWTCNMCNAVNTTPAWYDTCFDSILFYYILCYRIQLHCSLGHFYYYLFVHSFINYILSSQYLSFTTSILNFYYVLYQMYFSSLFFSSNVKV